MKKISFIGAGPGAKDLLTIRALECLRKAEVVIWTDSLINPEIIEVVPESCERYKTSLLTLEEIKSLLISKHRENLQIVRLHDGDTSIYSAINEQIFFLKDLSIPVEVIPGISAYQATSAALKTELTVPDLVQTIILSRSSGRTGMPEKEELDKLAALGSSLCLYLSARHVQVVQETLLNHYPPDTPVAIGYRVSWPDEWIGIVPLKDIAATSAKLKLIRTTIYIISPALKISEKRSRLYSPDHDHLFRQKTKK